LPAGILNFVLNGTIELFYDNRIFSEYKEVLCRKKFGFDAELVDVLLGFMVNSFFEVL
jgi:hypothetical protein